MITVILNGYRRGSNLDEQLEALNRQTVQPSEILLWHNSPGDDIEPNYEIGTKIPAVYCTYNFGVWARFAFAFMAKNEYICIFDDDTIPGSRWLENCMNTMQTHQGLLGTVGLLYPKPLPANHQLCSYYEHYERHGWPNPNEHPIQVDLVGHSWFFKKEWLSDYWREQPDPKYNLCGEDMHFSFMLQKYRNLPTFVPPHPRHDIEMWGSTKGAIYGGDQNSLWESNKQSTAGVPFRQSMHDYFVQQRRKGWRLVNEQFGI